MANSSTDKYNYTCAEGPGVQYANCRESFDDEHSGHLWLRQQHPKRWALDQATISDPASPRSLVSAIPVLDPGLNDTQYRELNILMSGLQPPETAVCFVRDDMWYHADQSSDLLSPRVSVDADESDQISCFAPRRPKTCALETCKPLQSYDIDRNKNDIYVSADKYSTMVMYSWIASGRTCFEDGDSEGVGLNLQTLESRAKEFSYQKEQGYELQQSPYADSLKPLYDLTAAINLPQVRKTPCWPRSWVNAAFYRCIPTGMHGPTRIFWANLTPFSPQPPLVTRVGAAESALCIVNTCREGHSGHLCSVCKPGFAKQLSSGICSRG
jgi:hypothetical protein